MEVNFKFEIGDSVVPTETLKTFEIDKGWYRKFPSPDGRLSIPITLYVVERTYQQCYNTHQIFYLCRPSTASRDGGERLSKWTEAELEIFDHLEFLQKLIAEETEILARKS
jgi:hypothetical protein